MNRSKSVGERTRASVATDSDWQGETQRDDTLLEHAQFVGGLLDAYGLAGQELQEHGMPLFAYAESDNYDAAPDEKRNHFINAVRNLPPGVSEFVIHCGYKEADGPVPPYLSGRVEDARVFQSAEMRSELNRFGVRLLDWKEFRERNQAR